LRTVLIDADILQYKMGFAAQKEHWTHVPTGNVFIGKTAAKEWYTEFSPEKPNWNDGTWSMELVIEPWANCKFLLDSKIEEIRKKTESDAALLCLSPKECFRNEIATTSKYKDRPSHKPEYYDKIGEYLKETYPHEVGDNVEADDLMGQKQTTETVIASIDKDLLMIPGEHYTFDKDETHWQDLLGADERFFVQVLAGDATDTIPGIPGLGVVGAEKLVKEFDGDHAGLVEYVKDRYEGAYGDDGQAVMEEMAALVWILRRGETPETAGWRGLLDVEQSQKEE